MNYIQVCDYHPDASQLDVHQGCHFITTHAI